MIGEKLVDWYDRSKRDLPWRKRSDPYGIWVSEILLQQTTVGAVLDRYEPFLSRFPTVRSLAAASLEEVLAELQGLGYYRRFRAMKRAAELIVEEHDGELPGDLDFWRALPGIGEYTAGAILSIAYHKPFAAVDGNVVRVISRLSALKGVHETPAAKRRIGELVLAMMPEDSASRFNQSLFDLGATVCLAASPHCSECPVKDHCASLATDQVAAIPEKAAKKAMVGRTVAVLLIEQDGKVLMWLRPADASRMPGFRELPEVWLSDPQEDPRASLTQLLRQPMGQEIVVEAEIAKCRHTITHHRLTCHLFSCKPKLPAPGPQFQWVDPNQLSDFPTSTITKKLLRQLVAKPKNR